MLERGGEVGELGMALLVRGREGFEVRRRERDPSSFVETALAEEGGRMGEKVFFERSEEVGEWEGFREEGEKVQEELMVLLVGRCGVRGGGGEEEMGVVIVLRRERRGEEGDLEGVPRMITCEKRLGNRSVKALRSTRKKEKGKRRTKRRNDSTSSLLCKMLDELLIVLVRTHSTDRSQLDL